MCLESNEAIYIFTCQGRHRFLFINPCHDLVFCVQKIIIHHYFIFWPICNIMFGCLVIRLGHDLSPSLRVWQNTVHNWKK